MGVETRRNYVCDLQRGVSLVAVGGLMYTGDKGADSFRIRVLDGGAECDLVGASVQGYVIRPDRATIPLAGTVDGCEAVVTLDESCYMVAGRAQIVVKVSKDGVLNTVFAGDGTVMQTSTDVIVDTSGIVPSLDELLAQISAMEKATADGKAAAKAANEAADAANDAATSAAQTATAAAAQAIQTVQDKLDSGELDGRGFQVLGYYDSLSALQAAVTSPSRGDAYGVGLAAPYDIYVWDGVGARWVNNGEMFGDVGQVTVNGVQAVDGNITLDADDVGTVPEAAAYWGDAQVTRVIRHDWDGNDRVSYAGYTRLRRVGDLGGAVEIVLEEV